MSDEFTTFGLLGSVGVELTAEHLRKALGLDAWPPPHPLHLKAMRDMLGEEAWAQMFPEQEPDAAVTD